MPCSRSFILAASFLALLVTAPTYAGDNAPDLPAARTLSDKVAVHEVALPSPAGGTFGVWIYVPKDAGRKKLPTVLIAPAGSSLFQGMGLSDGDRPEHLPWVEANFCVTAYEIDGAMDDEAEDAEVVAAIRSFLKADGGIANAKAALDYALAKVNVIDDERVYAVGHSSAATLALQVAANETRVKACVAFAPVADVKDWLGDLVGDIEPAAPGFGNWLERRDPLFNANRLDCPLMLFGAEDDDTVPLSGTRLFAGAVEKTNRNVKVVTVKEGGHYDSMIEAGIPRAIAWLSQLGEK